jgi:hypothetical protein
MLSSCLITPVHMPPSLLYTMQPVRLLYATLATRAGPAGPISSHPHCHDPGHYLATFCAQPPGALAAVHTSSTRQQDEWSGC